MTKSRSGQLAWGKTVVLLALWGCSDEQVVGDVPVSGAASDQTGGSAGSSGAGPVLTGGKSSGGDGSSAGDEQEMGGVSGGGRAGATQGGEGGALMGGAAGASRGGAAGSPLGGEAGAPRGGAAGSPEGGMAGSPEGGSAGSPLGGSAGSPEGGAAGLPMGGGAGTAGAATGQGGQGDGGTGAGGTGPICSGPECCIPVSVDTSLLRANLVQGVLHVDVAGRIDPGSSSEYAWSFQVEATVAGIGAMECSGFSNTVTSTAVMMMNCEGPAITTVPCDGTLSVQVRIRSSTVDGNGDFTCEASGWSEERSYDVPLRCPECPAADQIDNGVECAFPDGPSCSYWGYDMMGNQMLMPCTCGFYARDEQWRWVCAVS